MLAGYITLKNLYNTSIRKPKYHCYDARVRLPTRSPVPSTSRSSSSLLKPRMTGRRIGLPKGSDGRMVGLDKMPGEPMLMGRPEPPKVVPPTTGEEHAELATELGIEIGIETGKRPEDRGVRFTSRR